MQAIQLPKKPLNPFFAFLSDNREKIIKDFFKKFIEKQDDTENSVVKFVSEPEDNNRVLESIPTTVPHKSTRCGCVML